MNRITESTDKQVFSLPDAVTDDYSVLIMMHLIGQTVFVTWRVIPPKFYSRERSMVNQEKDPNTLRWEMTRLAGAACRSMLATGETRLATEAVFGTRLATQEPVAPGEEAQEDYQIGDYIDDRYEVLAIYRGSLGVVYGTYDHQAELPRALKTLRKQYSQNKQVAELFREEAALWVGLEKHPYIVRAYSVMKIEEQPFVVMEYITGPNGNDLRTWLGSPELTLTVAVEMALKIAQGMQYVQEKVPGLVHRDLKPANILVDHYAHPYITDFGLVYAAGSDAGTPAYMAPEQWRQEALTIRTDIYAFGCMLYEMLTGRRMYPATAIAEWRWRHLAQAPLPPTQLKPEIPLELEAFVLQCLAKAPAERPQSWNEVVEVLAGWFHQLTGEPPVLDYSAYKLDADELLNAASSLIQLGKYPEALAICQRIFLIDPDSFRAGYMKTLALLSLDRKREALDCFQRALESVPHVLANDSKNLMAQGGILKALDQYEEALVCFDQILATGYEDESVWDSKGEVLKELNRLPEALNCFNQALEIVPGYGLALWNKSKTLEALGAYEEALSCCNQYLQVKPAVADGWLTKGWLLSQLDRAEEGLDCFERATALEPDNGTAWFDKGLVFKHLKRYSEACDCFDRAIAIEPDKYKAWREKAWILNHLDRSWEAVDCLTRVLELEPDEAEDLRSKGEALYFLKSYPEALDCLDQALERNQDDATAWFYKLKAMEKLVGWDEVLPYYNQALAACPGDQDLWEGKGYVLDQLENYAEALACFDRALEIDPESCFAWRRKGIILYDNMKRYPEALDCFEKVLELEPEDTSAFYLSGLIFDKQGRYAEAVNAFGRATELEPGDADFWSSKGRSLYHAGRYEEAVASCKRALAICAASTWGLEYKGKALIKLNFTVEGVACLLRVLELKPDLDIWDD